MVGWTCDRCKRRFDKTLGEQNKVSVTPVRLGGILAVKNYTLCHDCLTIVQQALSPPTR